MGDFLKNVFMPDGFTIFIWVVAVACGGVLFLTFKCITALEKIVHPKNDRRFNLQAGLSASGEEIKAMGDAADKASLWYSIFANLTAIFPFLGILGTVISLIQIADVSAISENFALALRTTFWGIVFAIVYKVADAFVAPKLERALDESDYLIRLHDKEERDGVEAK